MREYIITENDGGQRLDHFLQKALPRLPKSLIYKWMRTKHIKLNGKRCTPGDRLQKGDVVRVFVREADLEETRERADFLGAPPELRILFESEEILAVEKPAGLVVHCDNRQLPDTLVNRVRHYLYDKGEYDPAREQSFAPALCNRLDRNTGGIVLAAKTAEALREMNRLIRENMVEKTYLCVVVGAPPKDADTITAWHKKSDTHNMVLVRDTPFAGARKIVTGYRVLGKNGGHTLLAVSLQTGRTHQIRAHLAHIGAPILGDNKYGDSTANRRARQKYQLLWAYQIAITCDEGSPLMDLNGLRVHMDIPAYVKRAFRTFTGEV